MKMLIHIWKTFKVGMVLFALLVVIGFTNTRQGKRYINDVDIHIDNQFENYFISQDDVYHLIHDTGKDYLLTSNFKTLNLKEIEQNIESHQFVNDAQAYLSLQGNLSINVIQNRPIARILQRGKPDLYIGLEGNVLPESSHYTARVLLIHTHNLQWLDSINIKNSEQGNAVLKLLQYIVKDEFWKAQIASIQIMSNQDVVLEPQVTKQKIIFGKPQRIEKKFNKLMTFYKQILPYKGWNTYSMVNLKYKNQIVCK